MMVLWVVDDSRDFQTIVCHLPADKIRSDVFVFGPYLGLPPCPVSRRRFFEFRHLEMRNQVCRLGIAFVSCYSAGTTEQKVWAK
jgi:hypothetical protein